MHRTERPSRLSRTATASCITLLAAHASGQSCPSTWVAASAITASAGSTSNSLPTGTDLSSGQSVQASQTSPWAGSFYTLSASTTFATTVLPGAQTFSISQGAGGSGNLPGGLTLGTSTFGSTLISLSCPGVTRIRISASWTGPLPNSPYTNSSIDLGNDSAWDWNSSQSQSWQTEVTVQGLLEIKTATSIGPFGSHQTLTLLIEYDTQEVGRGSPLSTGTPQIYTSGGRPTVGNGAFGVNGSSLKPLELSGLIMTAAPVVPLPGFQINGAQPGCNLLVPLPRDLFSIMVTDSSGNAACPLPIPPDPALAGLGISAQWLAVDGSLPYPLPIGSSPALAIRIGD